MNILILNNRDFLNPDSGGAEVFTHEIAKRWVISGHSVTWYCKQFKNSLREEIIDGIKIVRAGGSVYTYINAKKYYNFNKSNFDVVIDEYTLWPFSTYNFVDKPLIFLVHEVVGSKYERLFPPPLSKILKYIERIKLKKYKKIKTITVSNSTLEDLKSLGIESIDIVHGGINHPFENLKIKNRSNIILYVGLIKRSNSIEDLLTAYELIKKDLPSVKLYIVGRGPLLEKIKKIYSDDDNIIFTGYVEESVKYQLMAQSDLVLFPAVKEGWGLVVIESNSCGTPVVGYNIPGLCDSIINEKTGILCEPNPADMANKVIMLLSDQRQLRALSMNAFEWSKKFNWDTTADLFLQIINDEKNKHDHI